MALFNITGIQYFYFRILFETLLANRCKLLFKTSGCFFLNFFNSEFYFAVLTFKKNDYASKKTKSLS